MSGCQVLVESAISGSINAILLLLPPHPAFGHPLSPRTGEGVLKLAYASLLPTFLVAAAKTRLQ